MLEGRKKRWWGRWWGIDEKMLIKQFEKKKRTKNQVTLSKDETLTQEESRERERERERDDDDDENSKRDDD